MTKDNVTSLHDKEDPDWLSEANRLGRYFYESNPGSVAETASLKKLGDLIGVEPSAASDFREAVTQFTLEEPKAAVTKTRLATQFEREQEEAAINAERAKLERKTLAEAKRAQPFDPLRLGALIVALVLAVMIFVTSGLFSFATVAASAEWMRAPWPWLSWVVPGFVEAFIVFFGLDAVINQAKGRSRDAAAALWWMLAFTAVAVVANGSHTLSEWLSTGEIPWQGFVGIGMSALAPLSVVLITKRVSKLVFIDPKYEA